MLKPLEKYQAVAKIEIEDFPYKEKSTVCKTDQTLNMPCRVG